MNTDLELTAGIHVMTGGKGKERGELKGDGGINVRGGAKKGRWRNRLRGVVRKGDGEID